MLPNLFRHFPVDNVSMGRILCIPRFSAILEADGGVREGRVPNAPTAPSIMNPRSSANVT